MTMKKAIAAGVIMALAAGPALADEPKHSWTGFSVGVHGGMDLTQTDVGIGPLGINGLSSDGMAAGVNGGFDWHLPGSPIVLGIGADYTWSNTEFNITPGLLSAKLDNSWAVYGRAGIAMGHVMPYVLAGYTEADVSASALGGAWKGSTTLDGWMGGAGVEMMLSNHLTLGAEYRYTQFEDLSYFNGNLTLDTERHEVRAVLKLKLGSNAALPTSGFANYAAPVAAIP